ncbi:hypothetical protein Taro_039359 [Colocasia esculenta]|uniref:Secreted protein n=1 Tax=Colocasia esculenta TaxID=4460 RepID=A0A843WAI0_COLES|nr:hypothetical protein [Colocasia esculenta]
MEALMLVMMLVSLSILHQQQILAEGAGNRGLREAQHHQHHRKPVSGEEGMGWWWAQDYTRVRRSRPIHNRLEP